ncbi:MULTISPECIES: polyphosphate kinase 2 family protein [unclassified Sphingomonas]|uniref:polyphosphate kinase 2 family protein n=1 Tax=unclassified Sphingomonas TaxID=196159 RepID=UPI00215115BD|nr:MULTISPECIES: polyphosphate kinase [unclassified Sphingomonas]MCR5872338.1 polyphosphate kinase [Sphingomonas sp. J344]UUX99368.1 polyphosphate kinase [Sphingomonas sp. J315]
MKIDLSDFEEGDEVDDYHDRLKALQERLSHIQTAHIIHKRRAIIVFEGWDAAGKGGIIKRLTAEWDPRYFEVWPISAPTPEELAHHFLWRFWRRLPAQHNIAVFDRSWYGRVLVERVEGYASKAEWTRGYDEINDFEAQQAETGATLIKIFIHVTQKTQDKRLRERIESPWKRWKTGLDDYRNRARRADYLDAMHDMFARTNTKQAPWIVVDGNDKKAGRIAALTAIADALEACVPMEPPALDPAVETAAREAGVID